VRRNESCSGFLVHDDEPAAVNITRIIEKGGIPGLGIDLKNTLTISWEKGKNQE
jgi:hypothetical protein